MDLNGLASSRFHRHRRSPSSDRFLAAYPNAPPPPPDNYSSSFTDTNVDELNEDDIFTTDFSHRHHNTPASSSSSPSTPRQQHSSKNSNKSNLQRSELSGILAALPEISGYHRHGHHFYHKASLSTSASSSLSSSSSSRTIPSIPKPPQERIPISSSVGGKYHQSAPVNVPVLSQAMRRRREFDQVDVDDDGEEEGEMLPPHEIVARVSAQSQMLSCSVLEGVGRTLKGRDLRQAALLFALALSSLDLSLCDVVKGKVSCLDCNTHYDFSGIKVGVKCDQVKKLAAADTEDTGSFEVELPSDGAATSATPPNCLAKLLGGPEQLYALKANMISNIIKANEPNSYTISTPLAFSTSCPSAGKCGGATGMPGSSKTIDLPLPREWGFAPSSYYIPFFPIIGIP